MPATTANAAAPAESAVGQEAVQWIAVSPAYRESGLVIALGAPLTSCSTDCVHLWVSHNGGGSWSRLPATGWQGGRPVITTDARGHEVLLAGSGASLQRSDDGGATWSTVATGGTAMPALSPTFPSTGEVAVANPQGHDYLHTNKGDRAVAGSGGAAVDLAFMFAPSPSDNQFAPALLSAADPHTKLPVIAQCDADLACPGGAQLPGAGDFSSPVTLVPSTDFGHDGVVFAQSGRGIYKSRDGGRTFTLLPLVPTSGAQATATPMLALAPGYREAGPVRRAYAAVFQAHVSQSSPHSSGGVVETDDGGATWHPIGSPGPLDGGVMSVAVAPDGRLFAGYVSSQAGGVQAGLLCSQDGGATWHAACSPVGGSAKTGARPSGTAAADGGTGCAGTACTTQPPAGGSATGGGSGGDGSGAAGSALLAGAGTSGGGRGGVVVGGLAGLGALIAGGAVAIFWGRRKRASVRPPTG